MRKKLLLPLLVITSLYIVGTVIYTYFEHWSILDAIYFQTVTFTTVGFGDIVPKTKPGKLFTIFFIWVGISAALYFIYAISEYRQEVIDSKIEATTKKFLLLGHKTKNKYVSLRKKIKKVKTN